MTPCEMDGIESDERRRHRRTAVRIAAATLAWLALSLATAPTPQLVAQPPTQPPVRTLPPDGGLVQLNLPNEVDVKTLVDYVSQRLKVRILYDEQISNKKLTIRAPGEIPAESLLGVLQSALKMKGLALVDAEVPGWKRIQTVTQLPAIAAPGDAQRTIDQFGATSAVTQAFVLKHADPTRVDQSIKPFLSSPGANSIAMKETNVLIVTDYATNVLKIAKLVELIDQPKPDVTLEFYAVRNLSAATLAQQLQALAQAKSKAQGQGAAGGANSPGVEVVHDARTNQLLVVGVPREVDEVLKIARSLDTPLAQRTEVYSLKNISAERMDKLVVETLAPGDDKKHFRSTVDADGNAIIVTASPEIQSRVRLLIEQMDTPASQARPQSRVRFFKLKNVTVYDMLETLRGIETGTMPNAARQPDGQDGARTRGVRTNPTQSQAPQGQTFPQGGGNGGGIGLGGGGGGGQAGGQQPTQPQALGFRPETQGGGEAGGSGLARILQTDYARITADPNTNTLIVVADPDIQKVYEELVKVLDFRRPQVLIEAKVITLDTSDDFALGVEISTGDRAGAKRLFSFSSFGLSKVDPVTGALSIIPGLGFNGTLVDPDTADAVLRALTTHRRGRLMSSPRVVVNDNSTGVLASVAEVPFNSVNASQTVATTSFGGYAQAGTTIEVTPHISEGDHLNLEFLLTMNSFTGVGGAGIPPPRQTDSVQSKVTIPDGHTIIVGGLNRMSDGDTVQSFPFIEDVPILRHLAKNRVASSTKNSLFVFIRPVILRDDKFEDLKFLSERDARKASLPGRFPASQPIVIR